MAAAKPHIVVIPYPAQGHIPPIFHLSKLLAVQGFTITILNVNSVHKTVSTNFSIPPDLDIRLENFQFAFDIPFGMDAAHHKEWIKLSTSSQQCVEDFVRQVQPFPCCVISDFAWTWCGNLHKNLGIPDVAYWPGGASWIAIETQIKMLDDNGYAFRGPQNRNEIVLQNVSGVEGLQVRDIIQYPPELRDMLLSTPERIDQCEWILVNSIAELEPKAVQYLSKKFVTVGPLFPLGKGADRDGILRDDNRSKCLEWLDTRADKSVLYISFGSLAILSEASFKELARGLESSKQPFLWVIPKDLVELSDGGFMDTYVERTLEQGLVVPWAPQLQVLAHSSIRGFLSHCGWNSVMESLCNGVPILGFPCHSDQPMNCAILENFGLAKRFSRKEVASQAEVEEVITCFMGNNEEMVKLRSQVSAIKEAARKATMEGGSSHQNLLLFADNMKN